MKIKTTRFGEISLAEEALIDFPEGLVGFPQLRRFAVFDGPEGSPFKWLQSADEPGIAFVICDPLLFKPDYRVRVTREEIASIELEKIDDGLVATILVIPDDPQQMTANLLGPIVFNSAKRLGKQVVLMDPDLTTKYKVLRHARAAEGETPAEKRKKAK